MPCERPHNIRPRHGLLSSEDKKRYLCHGDDPDCPHPEAHDFKVQPMVDWLNPRQLLSTAMKESTAKTFGAYADKRETQAAMAITPGSRRTFDVDYDYTLDVEFRRRPVDELWFDYIADLGDGFDGTYSMARLLASDVPTPKGTLQQGRFVVLGGDQVYPTASREEYENRFLGPYKAAFPFSHDKHHLYALPGNHDWYDGLTSFLRIFCQTRVREDGGRWIGAWRTQQRRSYFALRLPHDWWIWGIDSQLESDLDRPQVEYFTRLAQAMKDLAGEAKQQKIILMTAEPNWVFCGDDEAKKKQCPISPASFNTLMWFENRLIRRNGFSLPLVIAGDLHHYVRYSDAENAHHRITAGGGGAYLAGTHQMPGTILLREGTTETTAEQMPVRTYEQQEAYPRPDESEKLTANVMRLPLRNRLFAALLGGAYSVLALSIWRESVLSVVVALALAWLFVKYAERGAKHQPLADWWDGWVHGGGHVVLVLLAWWIAKLTYTRAGVWWLDGAIVAGVAFVFGYFLGGLWFALYLLRSSRNTGAHTEEVFSSMAITGFKNFLRMHIDRAGDLHVYAIGVDEVPKDYSFTAPGPHDCGAPWFSPKTPGTAPRIVDELTIRSSAVPASSMATAESPVDTPAASAE